MCTLDSCEPAPTHYYLVLHSEIQLIEKNLHFPMIRTMNKHAMVWTKVTNKEERGGFPFHYWLHSQHLKKFKLLNLRDSNLNLICTDWKAWLGRWTWIVKNPLDSEDGWVWNHMHTVVSPRSQGSPRVHLPTWQIYLLYLVDIKASQTWALSYLNIGIFYWCLL